MNHSQYMADVHEGPKSISIQGIVQATNCMSIVVVYYVYQLYFTAYVGM